MTSVLYDLAGKAIIDKIESVNPVDVIVKSSAEKLNQVIEDGLHHLPILDKIIDFKNAGIKTASDKIDTVENFGKDKAGGVARNIEKETGDMFTKISKEDKTNQLKAKLGVDPTEAELRKILSDKISDSGYNPNVTEKARITEIAHRELELKHVDEEWGIHERDGTLTPEVSKRLLKRSRDIIDGNLDPVGRATTQEEQTFSKQNIHKLNADHRKAFNNHFTGDFKQMGDKKGILTNSERGDIMDKISDSIKKNKTINKALKNKIIKYIEKSNNLKTSQKGISHEGLAFSSDTQFLNRIRAIQRDDGQLNPAQIEVHQQIVKAIGDAIIEDDDFPTNLKIKLLSKGNKIEIVKMKKGRVFPKHDQPARTLENMKFRIQTRDIQKDVMKGLINDGPLNSFGIDDLENHEKSEFERVNPMHQRFIDDTNIESQAKEQFEKDVEEREESVKEAQVDLSRGSPTFIDEGVPEELNNLYDRNTGITKDILNLSDAELKKISDYNKSAGRLHKLKTPEVRLLQRLIEKAGGKKSFTTEEQFILNSGIRTSADSLSVEIPKGKTASELERIKRFLRPNINKEVLSTKAQEKINKIFTLKDFPSESLTSGAVEGTTKGKTTTITIPKEPSKVETAKLKLKKLADDSESFQEINKQRQREIQKKEQENIKKEQESIGRSLKDEPKKPQNIRQRIGGKTPEEREATRLIEINKADRLARTRVKRTEEELKREPLIEPKGKEESLPLASSRDEIIERIKTMPIDDQKFAVSGEEFVNKNIPKEDMEFLEEIEKQADTADENDIQKADDIKNNINDQKKRRERILDHHNIDPNGDFPVEGEEPLVELEDDVSKFRLDEPPKKSFRDEGEEGELFDTRDTSDPDGPPPPPEEDTGGLSGKQKATIGAGIGTAGVLGGVGGFLGEKGEDTLKEVVKKKTGTPPLKDDIDKTKNDVDNSDEVPDDIKKLFKIVEELGDDIDETDENVKQLRSELLKQGAPVPPDPRTQQQRTQLTNELQGIAEDIKNLKTANLNRTQGLRIVNNPTPTPSQNFKARAQFNEAELNIKDLRGKIGNKTRRFLNNLRTFQRSFNNTHAKLTSLLEFKKKGKERQAELVRRGTVKAMKPVKITLNIKNDNKPEIKNVVKQISKPLLTNTGGNVSISQSKKIIN